jgi:pimeloyl-ACP methyl ester carboxylesterase
MKPTVVLVHGAFAESASWDGVIASLREAGLPVIAAANPLPRPSASSSVRSTARSFWSRPPTQEALVEPSGDHPLWKDVPSWFVIGEQDRIIPAALQRFEAERAGARRTVEISGGSHASAVSRPDAVVELILEAARIPATA